VTALLGALVLSHWVLDAIAHRPDLPLWPGGAVVGLGLWYSIPGALILESPLLLDDVWLYTSITRATSRTGTWSLVGLLGLTTAIWVSQPWPPPAPSAGALDPPAMGSVDRAGAGRHTEADEPADSEYGCLQRSRP